MSRRVDWSDEAAEDFDRAIEFIAIESDSGSRLVATRILECVDRLGELPTGHRGRVDGSYEKLVQKTPYIVAYSITEYTIYILRIIHGARDWPDGDWPAE